MFEKTYIEAFSKVTASTKTRQEVFKMADNRDTTVLVKGRRFFVLAVAVLLLAAMTVTAFAAEDIAFWFREYFAQNSGEALSIEQMEYIEDGVQALRMSQTHNGYTLTVESALTDGFCAYLKLRLQAPEGVALNADDYGYTYKGKSIFYPADGSNPTRSGTWRVLDDPDPQDDLVEFLYVCQGSGFDAGSEWILELEDLCAGYLQENGFYEDVVIAEGVFRYELVLLDTEGEEVEMLSQPKYCQAKVYESESIFTEVEVILTSIIVRPLSAEILFGNDMDVSGLAGFGELTVVMRDGACAMMNLIQSGHGCNRYSMDVPIDIHEVDHILLPDGTRVSYSEKGNE